MTLNRIALLASAAFVVAAAPALGAPPAAPRALEQNFDALISSADQQQWLQARSLETFDDGIIADVDWTEGADHLAAHATPEVLIRLHA